jgi:hypothetical protein
VLHVLGNEREDSFTAMALQASLLTIAVMACPVPRRRSGSFMVLACSVSTAAYGVAGWLAYLDYARLCDQFPYVSMEERLPQKALAGQAAFSAGTLSRLGRLEEALEPSYSSRNHYQRLRSYTLEQMHEHTVEFFTNRPGFGIMRMPLISDRRLQDGLRTEPPPPQPGERLPVASLAASFGGPLIGEGRSGPDESLYEMH